MKIAILSGKGGTGKTFISTNLANTLERCTYIDCDVEEPNGNIFFKSKDIFEEDVNILLPKIDLSKCISCRECANFCKFNAISFIKNKPKILKNVCHSCGGCKIVCKQNAISEYEYCIGKIIKGKYKNLTIYSGKLNIGEESGIPIINNILKNANNDNEIYIIDCPPGTACSVIETISNVDYCIIVAEPTIFGVSNFEMVLELVNLLKKPFGVIVNKYEDNNNPMTKYCTTKNIPIIASIPFSKETANLVASGTIATDENNELKQIFKEIINKIISKKGL